MPSYASYDNTGFNRLARSPIPGTLFLIGVTILSFFLSASLPQVTAFLGQLIFLTGDWISRPWSLLTWPLVTGPIHPAWVFCICFWAWWVGGSLERSWGTRTFLGFFFAMALLTGLSVWAGASLLASVGGLPAFRGGLAGLSIALAPPTIAWCTINRRETISLYGVIPIPAPLLALLTLVIVWYEVGPPLLGLFGLISCGVAYWYAVNGRYAYQGYASTNRPARTRDKSDFLRLVTVEEEPKSSGFSPLRRYREWQERRALKRFLERPVAPDLDDREGRR